MARNCRFRRRSSASPAGVDLDDECAEFDDHGREREKCQNEDRDLGVPSEVMSDAKAREVLRAWVANEGLVCALRPETWPDVVA